MFSRVRKEGTFKCFTPVSRTSTFNISPKCFMFCNKWAKGKRC